MSSTLTAVQRELGVGPHLYRFTGAAETEETFVACSFWMVSALHLVGCTAGAHELMDVLLPSSTNDVGLLAEMVDPATGAHVGNLPWALSLLALLNAAITATANR